MKRLLWAAAVLTCAWAWYKTGESARSAQTLPTVAALPFSIEAVALSDLYKNNLKLATVYANVKGGDSKQWAATAVAIAQEVGTFGANSVEVLIMRSDVKRYEPRKFREVAHAYFSPDPARAVWGDYPRWAIYSAKANELVSHRQIAAYDDFLTHYEKLAEAGVPDGEADEQATAFVSKKYGLPKDWTLPTGNMVMEEAGVPRDSLNVDASGASASLAALKSCMDGKIIRILRPCPHG